MPQAQSPTIHRNNFIALFTAPDITKVYSHQQERRKKERECLLLEKQWRSPLSSVISLLFQCH